MKLSLLPRLGLSKRRARAGLDACAGLQFSAQQATLVRSHVDNQGAPTVEFVQRVTVDSQRRTELLRRWLHTGRLRDTQIVIVLSPGEYDLYQLPAPAVPDEELRDALRWQLRGTLPYSPEDAAIDFARIPAPPDAPPRPQLLVVAAPKGTVASAVAPCLEAGLTVDAVDIPEFAQRNLGTLALSATQAATGSHGWLSFEHNSCLLTVQLGTQLCFSRRIQVQGLDTDSGIETEQAGSYLSERIATQVQRSLDLYERQSGQPVTSKVTIAPHRYAKQIAQEIFERSGIAAAVFDPRESLGSAAETLPITEAWGQDLLLALGASLREHSMAQATPVSSAAFNGLRGLWSRSVAASAALWRRAA